MLQTRLEDMQTWIHRTLATARGAEAAYQVVCDDYNDKIQELKFGSDPREPEAATPLAGHSTHDVASALAYRPSGHGSHHNRNLRRFPVSAQPEAHTCTCFVMMCLPRLLKQPGAIRSSQPP